MAVPRLWLSPLPVTLRCGSAVIGKGVTRAALCYARGQCSQGPARLFYVSPASRGVQNSVLDFLRHFNDDKEGRGIEVIFPALVDDADVAIAGSLLVREHLIDFV